jgi:hypothetical protein
MKKLSVLIASLLAASVLAAPAGGAPAFKTLGTDAELDAAPSFDLTELAVRKAGKDLEIKIGLSGMTPPWGSAIPTLPGVEWLFNVKGKTYLAEAYTDPVEGPGFLLFKIDGDAFTQVAILKGTYDWQDGFVSIRVPLNKIKARPGTVISGAGKKGLGGTDDVDFHIHHAGTTYADYLSTTRDFRVPR